MRMHADKKDEKRVSFAPLLMTCVLSLIGVRNAAAQTESLQDFEALRARQDAKVMLTIIDDINRGRLDRICLIAEVTLKMDQSILDPSSNLKVSSDIDRAKNLESFKAIQEYLKNGSCKPHQS